MLLVEKIPYTMAVKSYDGTGKVHALHDMGYGHWTLCGLPAGTGWFNHVDGHIEPVTCGNCKRLVRGVAVTTPAPGEEVCLPIY